MGLHFNDTRCLRIRPKNVLPRLGSASLVVPTPQGTVSPPPPAWMPPEAPGDASLPPPHFPMNFPADSPELSAQPPSAMPVIGGAQHTQRIQDLFAKNTPRSWVTTKPLSSNQGRPS